MQIGPYRLENPVLLAPMAGVTDLPFRRLCRRFGAALAISEMVTADSALWASPKSARRLDFSDEPGPVAVQLLGTDPLKLAEAARRCVDRGAGIIDINMGCPAKKVCRKAAGSALLREPDLVARILESVVAAVPHTPVTLKIRTGWEPQQRNALQIGRIAERSGVQALTIHGRTGTQGFAGAAEYATIAEVAGALTIPVVANGDIDSPAKARDVLQQSGASGLMVGRAARGRPWIFREIRHFLATGQMPATPSPGEVGQILLQHLEELYQFHGEVQGVRIARKHINWYCRHYPLNERFRTGINQTDSALRQRQLVLSHFDRLEQGQELAA